MPRKPKFKPVITRVKLNPEQAVLTCDCYSGGEQWYLGEVYHAGLWAYACGNDVKATMSHLFMKCSNEIVEGYDPAEPVNSRTRPSSSSS